MKTLRELLAAREDLKAQGRKMLDAEGNVKAGMEAGFADIEGQLEALEPQIVEAQKAADRRAKMTAGGAVPVADPTSVRVGQTREALNPTGGFENISQFAQSVHRAIIMPNVALDERLQYLGAAGNYREGGSDGFLVPAEYRDRIWEITHAEDDWASEVDAEETASNYVNDLVDESTPWGATGVTAAWRQEAAQMTASKDSALKPRGLALDQLYVFVRASDELLEDSPRLNARLTTKSGQAIRWKLNDAIFGGTGVGQPLGFHTHASQISVAKEAAQAADSVVALNVANMLSRLEPGSIGRSVWLIHSTVFPQIMTLTIGNQPIWTPANAGFKEAPGGTLLGRPVRFSQMCKPLGDKGDIHLVDFKGYYALKKAGGVKFATSIHLYFDRGDNAFRWMFRFGGQPHLSAQITPKNGTAKLGHFVTLDERA